MTGVIKTISEQKHGGVSVRLTQEYGYYKSFAVDGTGDGHDRWDIIDKLCHNKWLRKVCKSLWKNRYSQCAPTFEKECKESTQNGGAYIFRPTVDQSFVVLPPRSVLG